MGDRESAVRYLADAVGITEVYASKTPEEKVAMVKEETLQAKTLYVGRGDRRRTSHAGGDGGRGVRPEQRYHGLGSGCGIARPVARQDRRIDAHQPAYAQDRAAERGRRHGAELDRNDRGCARLSASGARSCSPGIHRPGGGV